MSNSIPFDCFSHYMSGAHINDHSVTINRTFVALTPNVSNGFEEKQRCVQLVWVRFPSNAPTTKRNHNVIEGVIMTYWWDQYHAIQWRYNERDGVPNHRRHDCLVKRLFRWISKKTSKLRVIRFHGLIPRTKSHLIMSSLITGIPEDPDTR